MRITGGSWRSRPLRGPRRGMPLRPTPDALRERAFAVLGERVRGARFLDLFAGTGAVGLEALSRGAARTVFVERHRGAAALVAANRESLGAEEQSSVMVHTADRAVRELARRGERFELVWADPPFERWQEGLDAVALAARLGVLAAGGLACLECPAHAVVNHPDLEVVRDLAGGASRVVLLRAVGEGKD